MKIGIGLPTTLGPDISRGTVIDWARAADQAGFHTLGTIDKPSFDSWDPLISLAIASGVTERIRLMTSVLQLPNRNEVLVAKQGAVIDRVSGGRLDLGVSIGGSEEDFKVFGARYPKRGKKLERQLRKIRRTWRAAKKSTEDEGITGPAPLQKPLPPIWIGGRHPNAVKRALEFGDGYIFGAAGIDGMTAQTPEIRAQVPEKKQKKYQIAGLAYFALGEDPHAALEAGTHQIKRYYGPGLTREPESMIHHGPVDVLAEAVNRYAASGIDLLLLMPTIPDLKQLELIGEQILPSFRVPVR